MSGWQAAAVVEQGGRFFQEITQRAPADYSVPWCTVDFASALQVNSSDMRHDHAKRQVKTDDRSPPQLYDAPTTALAASLRLPLGLLLFLQHTDAGSQHIDTLLARHCWVVSS